MGADPGEPAEQYPEWYITVKAAQWLGVAPWELMHQPLVWTQWALAGRAAENKAEKILTERASKRKR